MNELVTIPIFELSALVLFASFIGFCVACYASPIKKSTLVAPRSFNIWCIGLICILLSQVLYSYAFRFLNPEQAEIIFYLWPIFLTLFCITHKLIPFSKTHLLATALCFIGVCICLNPTLSSEQDLIRLAIGLAFAIGAALTWSYYSFYCKKYAKLTTDYQSGLFAGPCSILCLLIHFCLETTVIPTLNEFFCISFMGIVVMNFSLAMWKKFICYGNFKIVSLFPYFVPIISVSVLIIAGKTDYSNRLIGSALLVSFGTLLPSIRSSRAKKTC